jgi:hypothetical protein
VVSAQANSKDGDGLLELLQGNLAIPEKKDISMQHLRKCACFDKEGETLIDAIITFRRRAADTP